MQNNELIISGVIITKIKADSASLSNDLLALLVRHFNIFFGA